MPQSNLRTATRQFWNGDLAVFGHRAISDSGAGRLRAAQVGAIIAYTPWITLASVFNAFVLVASMSSTPLAGAAWLWSTLVVSLSAFTFSGWLRKRGRTPPAEVSIRAIHSVIRRAAVMGAIWAAAPPIFYDGAGDVGRLVILCLSAGMMGGGAFALATVPAAALTYAGLIFLGVGYTFLGGGGRFSPPLTLLLASYTLIIARVVVSHAKLFAEHLAARIESQSQLDVIGLLLCDFEENGSDWLWETNEDNKLVHASPRHAALLGVPSSELPGLDYLASLAPGLAESDGDSASARAPLVAAFAARQSFRDLAVPAEVGGALRWWSLTGKAKTDAKGNFAGFRGVGADITHARESQARIVEMARTDSLTGLPNRLAFRDAIHAAVSRLSRFGERFAVLCLDLDHFKLINDTMGHHAGDALLHAVGERLSALMRPGDIAARIGGDEFTVILAKADQMALVQEFAGQIVAALGKPYVIDGAEVSVSASVGVAMAPADGLQPDDLLKNADLALYRAKAGGRAGYRLFEPNMDSDARKRRFLERDLRGALARGEFRLHFQPVIDLATNQVTAFEALLRWQCPTRGLVPPVQFISVLEEIGQIAAVGEWVLQQACQAAMRWPGKVRVAVNVSPIQFANSAIIGAVRRALEASRLEPNRLEVEITESVFIGDGQAAQLILTVLRQMGVRIALDDFGTGFSSLSYLRRMSFDKIKLDKSFIDDLASNRESSSIVRALIDLAGELGMAITAEGVETQAQLDSLNQKGCGEAQGYLFSRPVEGAQVAELLAHLDQKMKAAA